MRLVAGEDDFDIAFDAGRAGYGWHELGSYDLEAGVAALAVSSRSDGGAYVVADAVWWEPHRTAPTSVETDKDEMEMTRNLVLCVAAALGVSAAGAEGGDAAAIREKLVSRLPGLSIGDCHAHRHRRSVRGRDGQRRDAQDAARGRRRFPCDRRRPVRAGAGRSGQPHRGPARGSPAGTARCA